MDVIQRGTAYPLSTFQKASGLRTAAMRSLRRKGLKVHYIGGRAYVLGDDFVDFLQKCDGEAADGDGGPEQNGAGK